MELTRTHINTIERIIDRNGKKFVAVFAIVPENNTYKAKLVSLTPYIVDTIENKTLTIAAPKIENADNFEYKKDAHTVSPYQDFSFLVSQPTRAPNR